MSRVPEPRDLPAGMHEFVKGVTRHPLLDGRMLEIPATQSVVKIAHGLGRPYQGFISCSGTTFLDDRNNPRKDKEIWLTRSAQWRLVGHERVDRAKNSINFTGLDGDRDRIYKAEVKIVVNSAGGIYLLRPNSNSTDLDNTNADSQRNAFVNGTSAFSDEGDWTFAEFTAPQGFFTLTIAAATGEYRFFNCLGCSGDAAGPAHATHNYSGHWTDTTTKITSLEFFFNTGATEFGIGSEAWLYALGPAHEQSSLVWVF